MSVTGDNIDELSLSDIPDARETEEENAASEEEKSRAVELNFIHNANNVAFLKLPSEVLSYVFKWVVTDKLDVVSLARCALVCKAFYCLSQEPALWHSMCQRVWGDAVVRKPYPSWQALFVSRPHVHIHGVYISKTSYVRTGDASISFTYKPYMYVEYFRILRFFPNGEVLMLTTPQDPREVVYKLESKNKKVQGLLLGRYRLMEDERQSYAVITASLENYYVPKDITRVQSGRNGRANRSAPVSPKYEYHIEMKLVSTSSRKKFNKLVWIRHSCTTRYTETSQGNTNSFDISKQYPALFFNKIKSFTVESYKPL